MSQDVWLKNLGKWVWLNDIVKESGVSRVAVWKNLQRLKKRKRFIVEEISVLIKEKDRLKRQKLIRIKERKV